MQIQTFLSEKEFKQTALNAVAQMISDYASGYISEGNVADIGEQSLEYLIDVAHFNNLSSHSIEIHHQIIFDENENIRNFFDENSI